MPLSESKAIVEALGMKQNHAVSGGIGRGSTVELFDDWLYNVPRFFSFHSGFDDEKPKTLCWGIPKAFDMNVIGQAIQAIKGSEGNCAGSNGNDDEIKARLVDVPEKGISTPGFGYRNEENATERAIETASNGNLGQQLRGKRTCANAKKRLLEFFHAKRTTALICYLVSSEKAGLIPFFDRHAVHDKFVSDDATPGLVNKWVTELHLSFHQVLGQNSANDNPKSNFPVDDEIEFPSPEQGSLGTAKWVRRAVISFRFDGDFFDRFWTCHFFEYDPRHSQDSLQELDVRRVESTGAHWTQRRVLELVLFDRILERMTRAIDAILQEARHRVMLSLSRDREKSDNYIQYYGRSALADSLDILVADNHDAFLPASTLCHKVHNVLQVVVDDLDKNLEVIEAWSVRERERTRNEPRWTRKDEHRHREEISKWQLSNKNRLQELSRRRANIDFYNSTLIRRLEDIRNDLNLRGSDDIRLFTYITVLPVGIATSVFSMSEPPSAIIFASRFYSCLRTRLV